MNKIIIHLGNKPVSLNFKGFDEEVDVDQMLVVDHSNLYGEAVTIPALLNQVGLLKSTQEKIVAEKKMEFEIFESDLRQRIRKEHVEKGQKLTESSLNEKVMVDGGYKIKRKNYIRAKHDLDVLDNIWWAVKSKDLKLNNLIKGVTPEELYDELVEGTINNILIKKHKGITG